MADIPRITDAEIVAWVGADSLSKGRAYYQQGAVDQTRRQGLTLKGRCAGYSYPYYTVAATLAPDGSVEEAECNCPVESDSCKHVAALLLTYRHDPERFAPVQEVATGLAERSKEELIALIQRLLEHAPELSYLAEMRLPGAGEQGARVDPEPYRKQTRAVLDQVDYYDWQAPEHAIGELEPLLEIAYDFQRRGDPVNAVRAAMAILGEVIAAQEDFQDEGQQISGFVAGAVPLLTDSLPALEREAGERRRLLLFLLDLYWYGATYGPDEVLETLRNPLGQQTTPEERVDLARSVRSELDRRKREDWLEEATEDLLLDLEADTLDEETYLGRLRGRDRYVDLVRELLKRGRTGEAVEVAITQRDEALPTLMRHFESHGRSDALEAHLSHREKTSQSPVFLRWLVDRYAEADPGRALNLGERLFRLSMAGISYQELRNLAVRCGRWSEVYPRLTQYLESQNRWQQLSEAFILEGEIDRALALLREPRDFYVDATRIARAAEANRPREAIEVYRKQVQSYIDARGRGSYAAAANLLVRMRDLYRQIGEGPAWERYFSDLRERHKQLPALKDELKNAGL